MDFLQELYSRTQLAQSQLGILFSGQKKYFYETAESIIHGLDLPADKANMLRDFAEKAINLLDKAYPQAETKLQKLQKALESNNVKVELGPRAKKTLHITPEGEEWHVSAHRIDERWLFGLPIYRINTESTFPDILNLPDKNLLYLQAGWRASDECDIKGAPAMTTTQPWHVFAWSTVRYGAMRIYLAGLSLNKYDVTIKWNLKSSAWKQQWRGKQGKKESQQVAKRDPLGMLAWYLGDGKRHRFILKYMIGNDEKYEPRELVQQMIQAAYQTGYGKLLDLLDSEKWQALKRLQLKQHPVYATCQGYTFWLNYHQKEDVIRARTIAYTFEDAEAISQSLRRLGLQRISISTVKNKWKTYYYVGFHTTEVVKLAEKYTQWREAIKKLVAMHDIKPRGPVTHRLLELAENRPPHKKYKLRK
jgi:hypothetical protein